MASPVSNGGEPGFIPAKLGQSYGGMTLKRSTSGCEARMTVTMAMENARKVAGLFARPKLKDSYTWKHPLFFENHRWSRYQRPDSSSPPNIPIETIFLEWEVVDLKQLNGEGRKKRKRAGGMIANLTNRVRELEEKLAKTAPENSLNKMQEKA